MPWRACAWSGLLAIWTPNSIGRRPILPHFLIRLSAAIALLSASAARAEEALAAVAANFAGAAETLAAEFSRDSGHTITITTGATGKLYAQISAGAPFAILLSADAKTPEKLEAEGLAAAGSRFTYALGKLTLWSADAGRIGADPKAALTDASTLHVAIANPELAPYGEAARQTLEALGLWDAIKPKLVMGENIGQTFTMAASGAADMGFVAASALLEKPGEGSRWDVPQDMFSPIRQDAVLLKAGEGNAAAAAFLEYLKNEKARAVIAAFGYGTP